IGGRGTPLAPARRNPQQIVFYPSTDGRSFQVKLLRSGEVIARGYEREERGRTYWTAKTLGNSKGGNRWTPRFDDVAALQEHLMKWAARRHVGRGVLARRGVAAGENAAADVPAADAPP